MKLLIDIPEHIYEHAKETTEDSRDEFDAMRAIANGTQQESRSEIPNTCGDAISRQAAIRAIEALQRPIMREESNYYQFKFSGMSEALEAVENLPSVTPQQRTGAEVLDKIRAEIIDKYMTATGEVNTVAKGCLQIIDKYKAESEE